MRKTRHQATLLPVLFQKKRPPGHVTGEIHLRGQVALVGSGTFSSHLDGDLFAAQALQVEASATIRGSVHAQQITVAGTVTGPVEAREHVRLEPSARLNGPLIAKSADIEPEADFQGDLAIGTQP